MLIKLTISYSNWIEIIKCDSYKNWMKMIYDSLHLSAHVFADHVKTAPTALIYIFVAGFKLTLGLF